MKSVVLLVLVGLVVAYPTDNSVSQPAFPEIIKSIEKIRDQVKDMRNIALGNYTINNDDKEIKTANNSSEKTPTYAELADRVESASKKVKEIQALLKKASKHFEEEYLKPAKPEPKQEIETLD